MISSKLFPELDFGIILVPQAVNKQKMSPPYKTFHCFKDDPYNLLIEENYDDLIYFINKDVSKINGYIEHIFYLLTSQPKGKAYIKTLKMLCAELSDWHPFLQLHLKYYICDIILTYAWSNALHVLNTGISKNTYGKNLVNMINSMDKKDILQIIFEHIYDKIILPLCENKTDADKIAHTFHDKFFDSYYILYPSEYSTPLGELECFREFIAQNIPQARFDSNEKIWHTFFQTFASQYTDNEYEHVIHSDFTSIYAKPDPIILAATQGKDVEYLPPEFKKAPLQEYSITSFPHYILTQILFFKFNRCAIKLCCSCGNFYLHHSGINGHACSSTNENLAQLNQEHKEVYRKIYSASISELIKQKYDDEEAKQRLKNSGFLSFHARILDYALRHNIPINIYKNYTSDSNYTFDHYTELTPFDEYSRL